MGPGYMGHNFTREIEQRTHSSHLFEGLAPVQEKWSPRALVDLSFLRNKGHDGTRIGGNTNVMYWGGVFVGDPMAEGLL